jgi:hypothetical protein
VSGAHRTRRCRSSGTDGPALRASRSDWPEAVVLGRARVDLPDQVDGDHLHHRRGRCCVGRLLAGSAVAVLYLDGERKFSEGRWKSVPRIDVHAELVVAST